MKKLCETCTYRYGCKKEIGIIAGYCNTNYRPDKDELIRRYYDIGHRLDNLEGCCEDNPVYAAEVRKLRAEQMEIRVVLEEIDQKGGR